MDRSFVCSLSRFGAFFGYICAYRMGAFYCQYDFALLSWTTGGGDFRFQAVLLSLSLIRNDGQSLCFCFHTESCSSRRFHFSLRAICCDYRLALRNSQPYIQQLGQSYLTLFVINIIGSVLIPGISLAGHIGGAVGGAFLAVIFPVKWERRMYRY